MNINLNGIPNSSQKHLFLLSTRYVTKKGEPIGFQVCHQLERITRIFKKSIIDCAGIDIYYHYPNNYQAHTDNCRQIRDFPI